MERLGRKRVINRKKIRFCIVVLFGIVIISFGLVLRHKILAWPSSYDYPFGVPEPISVFEILSDVWHEPIDTRAYRAWDGAYQDIDSPRPFVPKSCLGRRSSRKGVVQLLQDYQSMVKKDPRRKATGFEDELTFLLSIEKKGDVYRYFRTPNETWRCLCGREGIALIRNGKAITGVITSLN